MYVGGCMIGPLWAFYISVSCLQEWRGGLLGSSKKLSMVAIANSCPTERREGGQILLLIVAELL